MNKKGQQTTIVVLCCVIVALLFFVATTMTTATVATTTATTTVNDEKQPVVIHNTIKNNATTDDLRVDDMFNPYVPPYRDDSYVYHCQLPTIPVRQVIEYRQIGLLTPTRGPTEDRLLPLMGRPLYRSGTKWQYYTVSNGHTPLKLPIKVRGKIATNDYGVDELDTGDHVHIEGHKEPFEVRSY